MTPSVIDKKSMDEFEQFLTEVPKHVPEPKETTIFSLGGRGYYENPTSDLLAFFLKPDREHRLGNLFLDAFLECLEPGPENHLGPDVSVEREVPTGTGGRMDLVLKGRDGVLLIENKIYHHQQFNPFDEYRKYGEKVRCKRPLLLAVLSPDGRSSHPDWHGVSYRDYCVKISEGLDAVPAGDARSKWWCFAREFVIHLQNELYSPAMMSDQITFAEQHEFQLQEAKKLAVAYRQFLNERLREVLAEKFPDHGIWTKDDGWGIRCKSTPWGNSDIVWWSEVSEKETTYGMNVYLCDPSPKQLELARSRLVGFLVERDWEEHWQGLTCHGWKTIGKTSSREEAETELIQIASILDEILHSKSEPSAPQTP